MKTKKTTKPVAEFDYRTIQTIKDAFKRKEVPFQSVNELKEFFKGSTIPERFWEPLLAVYQLFVGYEAINDDWKADFTKPDLKYWPWARVNSAGSGFDFSVSDCGCINSGTDVGSRLCSNDSSKAKHAFERFNEQYKKFWL
jgi:hypothetical protein